MKFPPAKVRCERTSGLKLTNHTPYGVKKGKKKKSILSYLIFFFSPASKNEKKIVYGIYNQGQGYMHLRVVLDHPDLPKNVCINTHTH